MPFTGRPGNVYAQPADVVPSRAVVDVLLTVSSVDVPVSMGIPTLITNVNLVATVIARPVVVNAMTFTAPSTVVPAVIARPVVVNNPVMRTGMNLLQTAVAVPVAVYTPVINRGAGPLPAVIPAPVSAGAPTITLSKTTAIPPDTILVATNATGSVSYIRDDPDFADSLYLNPVSDTSTTDVRVGFELPPALLRTGPDWQEFRIRLRKSGN